MRQAESRGSWKARWASLPVFYARPGGHRALELSQLMQPRNHLAIPAVIASRNRLPLRERLDFGAQARDFDQVVLRDWRNAVAALVFHHRHESLGAQAGERLAQRAQAHAELGPELV